MNKVARFTVSLDGELFARFDRLVKGEGYPTRSEAVKALIEGALTRRVERAGGTVAGAVGLLYDHHRAATVRRLMAIQHDFGELIISTQHIHLDHDHCLELVVVRGTAADIGRLVAKLKSVKAVQVRALTMTATAPAAAPRHRHVPAAR